MEEKGERGFHASLQSEAGAIRGAFLERAVTGCRVSTFSRAPYHRLSYNVLTFPAECMKWGVLALFFIE